MPSYFSALSFMKTTQETQTDLNVTTFDASQLSLFTSAHDELQALKHKLMEHRGKNWKNILYDTFALFQEIRYLTPTDVSAELVLCTEISTLCAEHIHKNPEHLPCHALYQRVIKMQAHYLRHHSEGNLATLQVYLGILEQYKQRLGLTTTEKLSDILGDTFDRVASQETRTIGTQTDLTGASPKPAYMALETGELNPITYADLQERLTELQDNPIPRRASKAVKKARTQHVESLERDTHTHIHAIKNQVGHEVIQSFELALKIQSAYIDHIRPLNNPYQLERALQRAAYLFRIFNDLYQTTDASPYLKAELAKSSAFMQEQALNIKQSLACGLVIKSDVTTQAEKERAQLHAAYYQEATASGLLTICAHYHNELDPQNEYVPPPQNVETTLPFELDEYHIGLERDLQVPQSEYDAHQKTRTYLNHALNILLPQPYYNPAYYQYADHHCTYNHDTSMPFSPQDIAELLQHPVKQEHLKRAITLYYDMRLKHLNSINPSHYTDAEFIKNGHFVAVFRKEAYTYLLSDTHDSLDQQITNYEQFINAGDCSSPLIQALAAYKLEQAKAELPAQAHAEATAPITPPEKQTNKHKHDKKHAPKKLKKPIQTATALTVWDLIAHQFHDVTAPGWGDCKKKINAYLKEKKIVEAYELIEAWLQDAPQNKGSDHVLHHNSLFDALVLRAIIFKHLKNYDEALISLKDVQQHLAPDTHATTRNHQMQKIHCELAAIYQARGLELRNPTLLMLAKEQLEQAKAKAREIGSYCFTALWDEIKNMRAVYIDAYPEERAFFFDNTKPLICNADNEPSFYKFYDKMAFTHMCRGLEALKQFEVRKALGRTQKGGVAPMADLQYAIDIYNRLINYTFSHAPEEHLDFHHKLATVYQCIQSLKSQDKNKIEASKHHENALKIAKRLGDPEKVTSILHHQNLTKTLSGNKERLISQAITHENRLATYSPPEEKYNEFMQNLTEKDCNYRVQYKNMLQAMQVRLLCSHVRAVLWLLDRHNQKQVRAQQDTADVRGQKVDLTNALLQERTTLLATVAGSASLAVNLYKEAYVEALKSGASPLTVLKEWHDLEQHYLAHIKHCEDGEAAERLIGTSTTTFGDEEDFIVEQHTQIGKIGKLIIKHGGTPSSLALPEIMQAHRTPLDLNLNPQLLSKFTTQDMPESFSEALAFIQKKQVWQALQALFNTLACFEDLETNLKKHHTFDKKKQLEIKNQTKPVYFLIACTLQWLFSAINSPEFTARITNKGHQAIMGTLSAQLTGQYKSYYNKANQGGFIASLQAAEAPPVLQLEDVQSEAVTVAEPTRSLTKK
jgi:hypothetical protein